MNWNRCCFYSLCTFLSLAHTHAFRIELFHPDAFSRVPLEHIAGKLGIKTTEFLVEGFESEHPIEGISSTVTGGKDEGGTPSANAWDGTRTSLEHNTAKFTIEQPGVSVFGIGLGDNDFGRESVSVNGNQPVALNQLPHHRFTSGGKAYYLLITAEEGDPDIRQVEFLEGFTIAFDHLILGKSAGSLLTAKKSGDPQDRVARLNTLVDRISALQPRPQRPQTVPPNVPPNMPPQASTASGISLLSPEGTPFLGNQLQFFARSEPGVLSVEKPSWLYLYWTEGRDFTLSGEVRLGGGYGDMSFSSDLPDGFALFLREWDGMHRYQLDSRRALAKRRLLKGARIETAQQIGDFGEPAKNQWLSFKVHISQSAIHFTFGQSTASIEGPLDIDGANKIAIAPGTKLRNLRLAFETPEESQRTPEPPLIADAVNRPMNRPMNRPANQSPNPSAIPPRGGPAVNIVNGGFDNAPTEGDEIGTFGETMFSAGSQRLPGWTVSSGLVGLRNNIRSPAGGAVLELGPRDTPGTIAQEIQTAPGRQYILSLYACSGRPGGNHEIKIQAGDSERTVECPSGGTYERVELPFRATSQVTRISIGAIGQSGFGPMIDDVRVELAGGE